MECVPNMKVIHKKAIEGEEDEDRVLNVQHDARVLYDDIERKFPTIQRRNDTPISILQYEEFIAKSDRPEKLQVILSQSIYHYQCEIFMRTADAATSVRVSSCAREGAALFTAIPKTDNLAFPEDGLLFRSAICMNLGLDIPFITPAECFCNKGENYGNRDGFHWLSQCSQNGNIRQVRHNVIQSTWAALIRYAGFHCTLEQKVDEDSGSRTDITVHNMDGKMVELDVSNPDPRTLLRGGARTAVPREEEAAIKCEERKIELYKERVEARGGIFKPIIIEAFGRFGPIARKFLKEILKHAERFSEQNKISMASYWTQRIVVAMRRSAMEGLYRQSKIIYQRRHSGVAVNHDQLRHEITFHDSIEY